MSLVLGSTAAATSARGEERAQPGPSAESERDRAVRDFQEGRRAHAEGRLEEAELSYLRAWSRMKSYDIATNLGQVQLKLNKPVSAARHLAFGLRTVGPEVEPERLEVMEALLAEAKAQVGALRVRVTNVADAEVYLDGERVPEEAARHELYLEPGEHVLLMRHAGYEDAVLRVITGPGLTETIAHRLKPKAEKAPGAGAAGAPAAAGPRAGNDAPPAKLPETTAAPREARSWVPVIALGAASAVGLGLGVGFTVASNRASAEVDAHGKAVDDAGGQCRKPTSAFADLCEELHDAGSRQETFGNAARVAFAASGALAIAAVSYALWPRAEPRGAASVRVLPDVSAHGAGVTLVSVW
ncbi:PEGA domain-containing protein [Sorangium sp. So ce513]|uniref:PEGA domain-containing protein n=1 Tax=Sorangium sp. So ce513 TaxID=3133315 RepID=UPI003F5EC997